MDASTEGERTSGQGAAAPAPPVPSSLQGRRARAALSLGLVALALLAGLAAWQGFLHSPWGARLGALNEIVFVGGTNSPDAFSGPYLYTVHPDGSGLRRLTSGANVSYFSPVWSPDGSRIAAFAVSGSVAHLIVMDADGSHARVIPAVALRLDDFDRSAGVNPLISSQLIVWSPDGVRLVAAVGVGQYALVNGDGTNLHILNGMLPVWSPNGRWLAYYVSIGGTQNESQQFASGLAYTIELLDTRTFQTRQLSHLPVLNAGALAWSPDGRALAVSAYQGGSVRSEPVDSVMLVPLDGGEARMVGQWIDGQVQQIAWSPDSQRLAVVFARFNLSLQDGVQANSGSDVWVVNGDGTNGHEIGLSDGGQPSWSPDGKQLIYASQDDIVLVVADASARTRTAARVFARALSLDFLFSPCWSPLGRLL
jgi:WD40 repeat protein